MSTSFSACLEPCADTERKNKDTKLCAILMAATFVQLCKCSGNEKLGVEMCWDSSNLVSPLVSVLLQYQGVKSEEADKPIKRKTLGIQGIRLLGEEMGPLAAGWEEYLITHVQDRQLPGCSHFACTNLTGPSEAGLATWLCGGCRRVRYCCDSCQRAAWVGGHKHFCGDGQIMHQCARDWACSVSLIA